MDLSQWLCFKLSRRLYRKKHTADACASREPCKFDDYNTHRQAEMNRYLSEFFPNLDVRGKDILDFGCGHGSLCLLLSTMSVNRVVGIDLDADNIDIAKRQADAIQQPNQPTFVLGTDPKRIDQPDQSFDIVTCFDVMEHVMDYTDVIPELLRVLRPGGKLLIRWMPWWHPFGPHINNLVPIPWAHVFFSDRTLTATCAKIYDMPEFTPRHWDLDDDGNKKPNKWKTLKTLPGVNRLSIRRFERLAQQAGLSILRKEYCGFRGAKRVGTLLAKLPILREFFTSETVYELQRPARSSGAVSTKVCPLKKAM